MEDLTTTLIQYGAAPEGFHCLDSDDSGLLPYATLLAARTHEGSDLRPLCGVYEWQASPLVFLVRQDGLRDENHFRHIRRCVALRGDAPYLALFRPGHLTIHRISLDNDDPEACRLTELPTENTRAVFPVLANSRPGAECNKKWISQIVLKLLKDTINDLRRNDVAGNDAISLTGRALFLRFLGDRHLLPPTLGRPENVFDDAGQAENACHWLDVTFNGDFLPLSRGIWATLPDEVFLSLGNIMRRAPDSQLYLGWEEKWNNLDFAHIPVGVLSEAYEQYMREHDKDKQRKEGSFYTPRTIVDLMVKSTFHGLASEGKASDAKVLDPAAGAGVFLVAAFRQLVANCWTQNGKRPDTRKLREILYHQITGFDINEAALRFAALGLYLMSIELDPEPEPVEKLKFQKNLRETVLFHLGKTSDGLGSLGNAVKDEHFSRYDLVIGNPPWASSTGLPNWSIVSDIVTNIARERLPQDKALQLLPNKVLDLPFVWRAMQWAKPGGLISFALHARLLFLQGDGMIPARSALFRALDVTGILNGADLCQTRVWPEIAAPFCLIFAKNQRPSPGSAFQFVSPYREDRLNCIGALRVDSSNAEIVTTTQVTERPEILKILYRGGRLDLEVYDRMTKKGVTTLEEYWRTLFGEHKGRPKQVGNGYQRLRKSSRIRKGEESDGLPGVSARYLKDLQELTTDAMEDLLVNPAKLKPFDQERIHDPRPRSLFRAPLLLVRESPPVATGRIHLALAENDVVFNQSYHGYSAWGHPQGRKLLRYLVLLIGSRPATWYVLVSSGRFGVERRVVEKITIDSIPIVPFELLAADILEEIDPLFDALVLGSTTEKWSKVDAWAAKVYGLRDRELQIINDTLRFNMPFAKYHLAAQAPPTSNEVAGFCWTLKEALDYWAQREQTTIEVQQLALPPGIPWKMVQVYVPCKAKRVDVQPVSDWQEVLRIADSMAATEVFYPNSNSGSLVVARLNQARYWSPSQANLVARRIVWEHLPALFGEDSE